MRKPKEDALVHTLKCAGPAEITSDNILLSFRAFAYAPPSCMPDETAEVPLWALSSQERGERFVCISPRTDGLLARDVQ